MLSMPNDFINIVIVIGAVAALVGAVIGIINFIKAKHRLIISVMDIRDSFDERGFIFIEFHIINMTNRQMGLRRFGLIYSYGGILERKVNFFLKPRESIVEPSGW